MSVLSVVTESPFVSATDLIRLNAVERGAHAALVCGGETMTYAALDAKVERCAAALQRDGVVPEDVVAICAASSIRYAVAFLGALRAGAAVALLSSAWAPDALAGMLDDAGASVAFVDTRAFARMAAARAAPPIRTIALDAPLYDIWLAPERTLARRVEIRPEWAFDIRYAWDVGGTPKGIVQPHAMHYARTRRGLACGYGPRAVTLVSSPLDSSAALARVFPTLTLGGKVVLRPSLDAAVYWRRALALGGMAEGA